jgi:hypothetical protein
MPLYLLAHVVLMALMVVLLVGGVVFVRLKRKGWFVRHRALAAAGALAGLAGALTMAITKHLGGWPHLSTLHSKVALPAILLVLTAPVLGALFAGGRPAFRLPHKAVGAVGLLVSVAAAALGILMAIG